MYELGMYDKLSKSFVLSKEESHRIEMTKKAVKFCDTLERKGIQYDYCIRHKEATGCVDYSRWSYCLGDDYAVGKHLLVQERKGDKIMAEKMTKAMWFEEIKAVVEASDYERKDEAIEFIDKQLELIASKAEKARERAAKTKAEGDELREAVRAALTDEFQTIDDIVAQIAEEGVTKAKVTARLTQLVKAEMAEKDQIKADDGRKVMAYRLVAEV